MFFPSRPGQSKIRETFGERDRKLQGPQRHRPELARDMPSNLQYFSDSKRCKEFLRSRPEGFSIRLNVKERSRRCENEPAYLLPVYSGNLSGFVCCNENPESMQFFQNFFRKPDFMLLMTNSNDFLICF